MTKRLTHREATDEIEVLRDALLVARVWMPVTDEHEPDALKRARKMIEAALEQ